jgi:hypothetical protein
MPGDTFVRSIYRDGSPELESESPIISAPVDQTE